jgi:glucan phosphoethanolaminetransferase (alkaline phosphatase superfamily)
MAIGLTVILLAILILGIWIFIEAKRMKHKIFAIFLIVLILFTYISFVTVLKGKNVDLKTTEGWKIAGKMYYAWLVNSFHNVKAITSFASKQDWKNVNLTNSSSGSKNKTVVKIQANSSIWDKL